MTQKEYVDALKSAVLVGTKDAVMRYLISAFPFFGMGFVNPITLMVVNYILKIAIDKTELGLFFMYVDLRGNKQGKEFSQAAVDYEAVKKTGDKKEIAKYEKNLIDKFRAAVKFTN